MLDVIQGLWIGPELGVMEQLSIRSFLANGHPYHLYVYEDVQGVPAGAEVRDAREILPESEVFHCEEGGSRSPGAFSDRFRYKLLLDRGGWWCDLDVVCLKPFDFSGEHVFCGEQRRSFWIRKVINGGIVRAPAGSPVMRSCYAKATRAGTNVKWGAIGPRLLTRVVFTEWIPRELLRLRWALSQVQPSHIFQPVNWWQAKDLVDPDRSGDFTGSYAIHLWNEVWRRAGLDKEIQYPPGCLYEQLKARYTLMHGSSQARYR